MESIGSIKKRDVLVRLNLTLENGEINFYSCSIKFLEEELDSLYDWSADEINANCNPKSTQEKLNKIPEKLVCDALLEQDIFSEVGNIIKKLQTSDSTEIQKCFIPITAMKS